MLRERINSLLRLVTQPRYRLYLGHIFVSLVVVTLSVLYYRDQCPPLERYVVEWESPTERAFKRFMIDHGLLGKGYVISPFDDLFISLCSIYELDWRLMSAICYVESRFRPHVVSAGGAIGMMQIMPQVGRAYKVSRVDLFDPQTNIETACKHYLEIQRMMSIPHSESEENHIKLALVCYNGGIGRLFDAQRLTQAQGGNIYDWGDIKLNLLRLMRDDVEDNALVYYGRFPAARYTIAYVRDVMSQYREYRERSRHCSYTLYPYARITQDR